MGTMLRSQFGAALVGGLVVAGTFLALGVTGRRTTRTIVGQSPMSSTASGANDALTPNAIYVRDAPAVVLVKAAVGEEGSDPFDAGLITEQPSSTGSGFLIDSKGYILTDYHLIDGADARRGVTVDFENGVTRQAIVAGFDASHDLALLKVDMAGVPRVRPLVSGDSTSVSVGDPTLAIGNPFGHDRTLTSGIVSALQSQLRSPGGFAIDNVIQIDTPVDPGNSGGPLLDAAGRVIGINSQLATAGSGAANAGIAFAIPINTAEQFVTRALAAASCGGASSLRCGHGATRAKNQVLRDYRPR
jgi:S1-C subfamily serine protease